MSMVPTGRSGASVALGALFAGLVFHGAFLDPEEGLHFWGTSIAFDAHLMHALHETPLVVKLLHS